MGRCRHERHFDCDSRGADHRAKSVRRSAGIFPRDVQGGSLWGEGHFAAVRARQPVALRPRRAQRVASAKSENPGEARQRVARPCARCRRRCPRRQSDVRPACHRPVERGQSPSALGAAGVPHGFVVLSETADFFYKCDELYSPSDELVVRWNDPALGISWGIEFRPFRGAMPRRRSLPTRSAFPSTGMSDVKPAHRPGRCGAARTAAWRSRMVGGQ